MLRPDHAAEVRRALASVADVCAYLGIEKSKTEHGKWICPQHGGGSLSLRVKGGTIQARCFGCDFAGDALSLIAAARGLDVQRDFPEVLLEGARIGGLWPLVDELEKGREGGTVSRAALPVQRSTPAPRAKPLEHVEEVLYPDVGAVAALWAASSAVQDDAEVCVLLEGRALSPAEVDTFALARVLPPSPTPLPRWAGFKSGRSWRDAGYRLIVPLYDASGTMRSFRAWRVGEGEGPKRVLPTGCKSAGLVFACPFAVALLEAGSHVAGMPSKLRLVIAEGDGLNPADEIGQGGVFEQIFEFITVGGAD